MRWALVLATMAMLSGGAHAQTPEGELRLSVGDAGGLPVTASGALVSEASHVQRSFVTDAAGRFTFEHLPFGVYRVTAALEGFSPATRVVEIRSAVPVTISLRLNVAPVSASVDVRDSATLLDTSRTGVSYASGARDLDDARSAVPGRTVIGAVDMQPGWLLEANGVLHPRGSEYQTLFVVDGIPIDENRSPAYAPAVAESDVHAISVMTGNYPAEYGRKLGGVVAVTTNQDIRSGTHGTLSLDAGGFGTFGGAASMSYGWEHRAMGLDATIARTDRYLDPPVTANDTNAGSLGGVTLRYDDRPTDRDRLHLAWHERRTRFGVPNELLQQVAGQRQDRAGAESLGQAAWSRVTSPRSLLEVRGAYAHLSADLWSNARATPIVVSQSRGFRRGYAAASMSWQTSRHAIKIGGDAVYAPVREALQFSVTDPSAFDDQTPAHFQFADRRTDREASAYVQDTARFGPITASAGLRFDRYAFVVSDHAFSPRLGVAWALPSGHVVLRASYDRAFETPAIENLLLAGSPQVDVLNPRRLRLPVRPSRGNYVEGGASARVLGTSRLDVTAYRRTFDNFADDDVFLNTGISFPIAFSAADIRGVDVKMTIPGAGGATGSLSYSYLRGFAEGPVAGGLFLGADAAAAAQETGRFPITQDQRHTIRARAQYALSRRAWIAAVVRYGSGLPTELGTDGIESLAAQYGPEILDRVNLAAGRVRPNASLDLAASLELWTRAARRARLVVHVENVTNRLDVIDFAGLFSGTAVAPPRSAGVRLAVDF